MKEQYPKAGIKLLCGLFGKTRHAFYDNNWREDNQDVEETFILKLVLEIRKDLPKLGTRKLIYKLNEKLGNHKLNIGRDRLFDLLESHDLLIRRRKRKAYTTNSLHRFRKYPNLIRELVIERPEEVWVSDITYLTSSNGFYYLSLVTDAYSRKIMGYSLSYSLHAKSTVNALKMALNNRQYHEEKIIHHSDRGIQYCCKEYVNELTSNDILISMTMKGDPYENAIAERVNGILKGEFALDQTFMNFEEALQILNRAIFLYNTERPHASCDYLTPEKAHQMKGVLQKRWKNYYKGKSLEQGVLEA